MATKKQIRKKQLLRARRIIKSEKEYIDFVVRTYYRWLREETDADIDTARRNALEIAESIRRALRPNGGGWGGLEWGVFPSLFNSYLSLRMCEQQIVTDY